MVILQAQYQTEAEDSVHNWLETTVLSICLTKLQDDGYWPYHLVHNLPLHLCDSEPTLLGVPRVSEDEPRARFSKNLRKNPKFSVRFS